MFNLTNSPFQRILRQPITDHRRRRQTHLSDMSSLWVQVSSSSLPCRALRSCTVSVSRPTLQRQSVDLPKVVHVATNDIGLTMMSLTLVHCHATAPPWCGEGWPLLPCVGDWVVHFHGADGVPGIAPTCHPDLALESGHGSLGPT